MNSIIQANDLTKKYQDVVVVDHISFDVGEGEIFGFLGPNGAGKTTTIRMLTTLAAITEGACRISGYDVAKNPARVRSLIGLVPQQAAVDMGLTGIENLFLTAALFHVPKRVARQRAEELLDLVDLKDVASRRVGTYSGGMRKRLEIISGLMHEPKILFLDEPTLGLDIQTRLAMWGHIKGINTERHTTIFLTTHYLEEADSLCKKIAIIDHGKIKVLGSPLELKTELGSDVLELEVASPSNLKNLFESVAGVKEVVKSSPNRYTIKLASIEQSLQAIFDELSKLGIKVVDTKFSKSSLDQVFLETTGRSIRDEISTDQTDGFLLRAQVRRERN
jgi:ABC-2 type transport system ATP-binding protein